MREAKSVVALIKLSGVIALSGAVLGCGAASESAPPGAPNADLSIEQRQLAVQQTASQADSCTSIQPFYWEIGDKSALRSSGTVGGETPNGDTSMLIASASKWVFAAYVLQERQGVLTDEERLALTMRAGYDQLRYGSCVKANAQNQAELSVQECFAMAHTLGGGRNDEYTSTAYQKFAYNGGHFQWLAAEKLGLGAQDNAGLAHKLATTLGNGFAFSFASPQPAAGMQTTAHEYGKFLRQILNQELKLYAALGTEPVCTNPNTCQSAVSSPIPSTESWHYSLGHWVEDDALTGDGAFSSPGAFGFYPWLDASKTYYGILARFQQPNLFGDTVAFESVQCGRKLRQAWLTGKAL